MPSVRNWVYGAYPPTTHLEKVREQMRLANLYFNELVRLERRRRDQANKAARQLSPEFDAALAGYEQADAAVDQVIQTLRHRRQRCRRRLPLDPELEQALAAAKKRRQVAYERVKETRAAAYAALKAMQEPHWPLAEADLHAAAVGDRRLREKLDAALASEDPAPLRRLIRPYYLARLEAAGIDAGQAAYEREQKLARANCGCYHGTYLVVEEAAAGFGSGPPPRPRHHPKQGTIAVQLIGGLTVDAALHGNDSRLQLRLPNEERLVAKGKDGGLRARGLARIRIASDEQRQPIWAELPVVFHRPLPPAGVIKWAYVHCERIGTKDHWRLRLTIVSEPPPIPAGSGTAAVHVGWRLRPDGSLRVATLIDDQGRHEEVCLPGSWIELLDRAAGLRRLRDRKLHVRAPRLIAWLRQHDALLPEALRDEIATIEQWRSQARFAGLWWLWRRHRFEGDSAAHRLLGRWRVKDKHLYDWETAERTTAIARRRQLYRTVVRRWAETYARIVVVRYRLDELLERERDEDPITQTPRQRHHARFAAPAELLDYLEERAGGKVEKVSHQQISMECHQCGQVEAWDRRQLEHTCGGCGSRWDQDTNAALVQLARASSGGERRKTREALDSRKSPSPHALGKGGGRKETGDGAKTGPARKTRRNRKRQQLAE